MFMSPSLISINKEVYHNRQLDDRKWNWKTFPSISLNILCMCACVYLAGQLSGWRNDHSSEAQVDRLLQVGQQRETESQSLSWSCGSAGQQLPTLIQTPNIDTKHGNAHKTTGYTPFTHNWVCVCVCLSLHSHASWAVLPASALASGNSARRLWGSGGHGGWDDTRTAAPQMYIQGQAHHCRARLYGVASEHDSPKIK